jgi:hypothetical protein
VHTSGALLVVPPITVSHRGRPCLGHAAATAALDRKTLIGEGATAIVAPDHEAAVLFERVLCEPGADRWPFDRARIQLTFGEGLRRMKAAPPTQGPASRQRLILSRAQSGAMGSRGWQRAPCDRTDHRSSGRQRSCIADTQQRQIATLAAAGKTNKQIGERLYLSPRTVSTHLHQVFPKLGVTTRAALRDALAGLPPERPLPHAPAAGHLSSCRQIYVI